MFGNLVRERRAELGMNLKDVATRIGVSVSYVSEVERGTRAPYGDEKLFLLAAALKMPLNALHDAALATRGITLDARGDEKRANIILELSRTWETLTPQQLDQLEAVLDRKTLETPPAGQPKQVPYMLVIWPGILVSDFKPIWEVTAAERRPEGDLAQRATGRTEAEARLRAVAAVLEVTRARLLDQADKIDTTVFGEER